MSLSTSISVVSVPNSGFTEIGISCALFPFWLEFVHDVELSAGTVPVAQLIFLGSNSAILT